MYVILPGGGGGTIASARPKELHLKFLFDMGLLCSTSNNSKVYKIETYAFSFEKINKNSLI